MTAGRGKGGLDAASQGLVNLIEPPIEGRERGRRPATVCYDVEKRRCPHDQAGLFDCRSAERLLEPRCFGGREDGVRIRVGPTQVAYLPKALEALRQVREDDRACPVCRELRSKVSRTASADSVAHDPVRDFKAKKGGAPRLVAVEHDCRRGRRSRACRRC